MNQRGAWEAVQVRGGRVLNPGLVSRARCRFCPWVGPKRLTAAEALKDGRLHDKECKGQGGGLADVLKEAGVLS
jgi:hypothetical protein